MAKNKNCAGTYKVSGYTREDGTKVDSYWRTCGAKHEGDNSSSQRHRHQSKSTGMIGGAAPVEESNFIEKEDLTYKRLVKALSDEFFYNLFGGNLQEYAGKNNSFDEIYYKYYKLSLDYENQKQYNKENVYVKFKDLQNEGVKSFIQNNLDKLDIPYVDNNTNVVIPQQDSRLVKTVYNSPEFKDAIKSRLLGIKSGEYKNKSFNITFDKTQDAHLTLGHATLYNVRIVDGYICGTLIDYYNFSLSEKYNYNYDSLKTIIANNNAYFQQETGRLKNYLIIYPIRIPVGKFM